jgi:hypothetical protein
MPENTWPWSSVLFLRRSPRRSAEARAVSVRHHGKGDLGARPLAQFVTDLQAEVAARTVPATAEKAAS